MPDVVLAYINYLQSMSRKIAYRGSFAKVLGGKPRTNPDRYLSYDHSIDQIYFQKYLTSVMGDIQRQEGRKLFLGHGLIFGNVSTTFKLSRIAGPLLMTPCLVTAPDDTNDEYVCEPLWEETTLNYDLLTELFEDQDAPDPEDIIGPQNQLSPDIVHTIFEIERQIQKAVSSPGISHQINHIFLQEIVDKLRNQISRIRGRIINHPTFRIDDLRQITNNAIYWANHRFYFMAQVPHALSAYQALKNLHMRLQNEKSGTSTILHTLLHGVLVGSKITLRTSNASSECSKNIIRHLPIIPLPLSERQKQAIINAFSSDISYIQGPPGTGKSHTIAAIMIMAILLEKRVLLTSHKKAAIDVVRAKLKSALGLLPDDAEIAIYVGPDTTERKAMLAKISELMNLAERWDYKQILSSYQQNVENKLEELDTTLQKISKIKNTLNISSDLANAHYRAHQEFLRKKSLYQQLAFGDYDISSVKLSTVAQTTRHLREWRKRVQEMIEIQSRRSLQQPITGKEVFRLRVLLNRYRKTFQADWLAKAPWNAHRLESHFEIYESYCNAAEKQSHLHRLNLNQIHETLNTLELTAQKQAQDYLRALLKLHQLQHAKSHLDDLREFSRLLRLKNPRLIEECIKKINYSNITKIFPLWVGEMRDLGYILPFQKEIFDLLIVDEASQVNIAEIIPVFHRASAICVVGDRAQLGLEAAGLFGLNRTFNQLAWNQAFKEMQNIIPLETAQERALDVTSSSILDFIVAPANSLQVPQITLNEHFRSMPSLASYTSSEFYQSEGGLRIMTEVGNNLGKECFTLIETGGTRSEEGKFVPREVERALQIVQAIASGRELNVGGHLYALGFRHADKLPSVGIISFTTDQRNELRARAENEISPRDRMNLQLFIGTPEEFQGNERDVVLITFALGEGMKSYAKRFYEDPHRLNVATSRARKYTYAIIGRCPARATLLRRYFNHFGYNPTIDNSLDMEDAIPSAEDVPPSRGSALTWHFDERLCESEFEHAVLKALREFIDKHPKNTLEIYNQVTTCGQKRIDFVLYDRKTGKSVAIEVDGKDHFCSDGVTYHDAHLQRVEVLRRAGWNIVHVPYYEWYEHGWLIQTNSENYHRIVGKLFASLRQALNIG